MNGTGGMIITNNGLAAITAAEGGEELIFTRIKIGQGYPPEGQDIDTLLDVAEPIEVLNVVKFLKIPDRHEVIIGGYFTNNERADSFFFREVGLFATTPTTGEVLFAYGNAGDNAEYIPAGGGWKIVEKSVDVVVTVGNTEKVSALIDSGVYATREDMESVLAEARTADGKAQQALDALENIDPCPPEGCPALQALAARVARLEIAVFDEMKSNPFMISFNTLAGKTVYSGNWNAAQGRLEC